MRYTIFRTRWGWFGLLGDERGLIRTCLPLSFKSSVEKSLLKGIAKATTDPAFYKSLQKSITSYYEGNYVVFSKVTVCLDDITDFQRKVLTTLRKVKYGQTVSYRGLAKKAGSPMAIRAIGQVMARNPMPLIIPCHRVVRTDGSMGGFSALGGVEIKKRMLALENSEKNP